MAFTFLANSLNKDLAERICMEATRMNMRHVLVGIPKIAEKKVNRFFIANFDDKELIARYSEEDERIERENENYEKEVEEHELFDDVEDRMCDLLAELDFESKVLESLNTGFDDLSIYDEYVTQIKDSLHCEFGDIMTFFMPYVYKQIKSYIRNIEFDQI